MIELTAQQERFCQEYIVDLNATQSAIRAGYSVKTADVQGCRLLGNVKVQARISELNKARMDRVEITADTVLKNLYEIATLDIADVLNEDGSVKNVSEWSEAWRKAVSGLDVSTIIKGKDDPIHIITKAIRGVDRLKAWELIGKHIDVSAFKERLELTGENGQPLVINVTTPESKSNIEALKEGLKEK